MGGRRGGWEGRREGEGREEGRGKEEGGRDYDYSVAYKGSDFTVNDTCTDQSNVFAAHLQM